MDGFSVDMQLRSSRHSPHAEFREQGERGDGLGDRGKQFQYQGVAGNDPQGFLSM
jgi:hypothetical protein